MNRILKSIFFIGIIFIFQSLLIGQTTKDRTICTNKTIHVEFDIWKEYFIEKCSEDRNATYVFIDRSDTEDVLNKLPTCKVMVLDIRDFELNFLPSTITEFKEIEFLTLVIPKVKEIPFEFFKGFNEVYNLHIESNAKKIYADIFELSQLESLTIYCKKRCELFIPNGIESKITDLYINAPLSKTNMKAIINLPLLNELTIFELNSFDKNLILLKDIPKITIYGELSKIETHKIEEILPQALIIR